MLIAVIFFSFCDPAEITEEALTCERHASGRCGALLQVVLLHPWRCRTDLLCVRALFPVSLSALAAKSICLKRHKCVFCSGAQMAMHRLLHGELPVGRGADTSRSHASLMFAFCRLTFTGWHFVGAAAPALSRNHIFAERVRCRVLPLHPAQHRQPLPCRQPLPALL